MGDYDADDAGAPGGSRRRGWTLLLAVVAALAVGVGLGYVWRSATEPDPPPAAPDDPRIRSRVRGLLIDVHAAARPEHRTLIVRKLATWKESPVPVGVIDLTPSDIGLRAQQAPLGFERELPSEVDG